MPACKSLLVGCNFRLAFAGRFFWRDRAAIMGRPTIFTPELADQICRDEGPSKATIYALECPESGEVRYVGKANDAAKRLAGHLRDSKRRNTPVCCWIRSLSAKGLLPQIRTLETVEASEWVAAERKWIAEFRSRTNLLNLADGGNQPSQTQEQRAEGGRKAVKAREKDARSRRLWRIRKDLGDSLAWAKKHRPAAYERVSGRLRPYLLTHPHIFAGIKALHG